MNNKLLNKLIEDENKLFESWEILPEYFITSSINDIGKEEMLSFIAHHNQSFN